MVVFNRPISCNQLCLHQWSSNCLLWMKLRAHLRFSGYSSRAAWMSMSASSFCFWAVSNNTRRWREWTWSLRYISATCTHCKASEICPQCTHTLHHHTSTFYINTTCMDRMTSKICPQHSTRTLHNQKNTSYINAICTHCMSVSTALTLYNHKNTFYINATCTHCMSGSTAHTPCTTMQTLST